MQELGVLIGEVLVLRKRDQRGRAVLFARARTGEMLPHAREGDHIAGCLDAEAVVQVRNAEVMDGVAVVVLERDHGCWRIDSQVEPDAGLHAIRHWTQADLVKALVSRWRVGVLGAMRDPVAHVASSGHHVFRPEDTRREILGLDMFAKSIAGALEIEQVLV